jgi:hypothetical protein
MMIVSLLNGSSVVDIGNDGGVESSSIVALFRAIVATGAGAYVIHRPARETTNSSLQESQSPDVIHVLGTRLSL